MSDASENPAKAEHTAGFLKTDLALPTFAARHDHPPRKLNGRGRNGTRVAILVGPCANALRVEGEMEFQAREAREIAIGRVDCGVVGHRHGGDLSVDDEIATGGTGRGQ